MKKITAVFILAMTVWAAPGHALVVTTTSDAGLLSGTLLGSGIALVGTASYGGDSLASGIFGDGLASGLGIDSGIILTNGNAEYAVGPNDNDDKSYDPALPGDPDLEAMNPGVLNVNAAKLEFDFTTGGGDLYFTYVFASEVYDEKVGFPFNDLFAFFVDGVNIALVPGTADPVGIDTINGGNSVLGVSPSHPEYFISNRLTDSDGNFLGGSYDVQYDGFTTPLTAYVSGLTAGTHHMKMVIGATSVTSGVSDSAVFIKAGSFSDQPPANPVPEPATLLLLGAGFAAAARVKRSDRKSKF